MPETPGANTMPAPSVGRIVHFMYGDQHCAAIITARHSRMMDASENHQEGQTLCVFPPMEAPFSTIASYDPDAAPATWHWPEHVPSMTPPLVGASLLRPGATPTPADPRLPVLKPKSFV